MNALKPLGISVDIRNAWLSMTDEELSAISALEMFKGSGNGGQKRNKTSSAVRIVHLPTGISVTDCSQRSQTQNRHNALKKMRLLIALNIRVTPNKVVEINIKSLNSPEYPLWLAEILDLLHSQHYDIQATAQILGLSSSKIIKLFYRDHKLWQLINRNRELLSLPLLRKCSD
jgi:hypothetical protein